MTAAAFNKIERGLREALEVAQAGDDEIADRLTREKKAQDSIRACIETQERRAHEAVKGRSAGERRG